MIRRSVRVGVRLGLDSAGSDSGALVCVIEEYKPQFPPRHEFTDDELRAIDVPRTTHALPLQEPDLTISRILALVEDDRSDLPE